MKNLVYAIFALCSGFISLSAHAEIERFERVTPGIFRGGQPASSTDFASLKQAGVRTVIDLRIPSEENIQAEDQVVTGLGMIFRSYPMQQWTYPNANEVGQILADMNNSQLQPVFIHCHEGRDRTGMMIALERVLYENVPAQQAQTEWESFGFKPTSFPELEKFFQDHTQGH